MGNCESTTIPFFYNAWLKFCNQEICWQIKKLNCRKRNPALINVQNFMTFDSIDLYTLFFNQHTVSKLAGVNSNVIQIKKLKTLMGEVNKHRGILFNSNTKFWTYFSLM